MIFEPDENSEIAKEIERPPGKKIITTVPTSLLEQVDALARSKGMTRRDLVLRGLRSVIRLEEKGELI